jgi:hypothetical protein
MDTIKERIKALRETERVLLEGKAVLINCAAPQSAIIRQHELIAECRGKIRALEAEYARIHS